jgi:CHAD domain-containing protein
VALARAGRDRRSQRQHPPDPRLGILPGESLAEALQRTALGQVETMLELLHREDPTTIANTVHETRKALKRLRALLRLLEHELGSVAIAHESDTLRNVAQRLSSARDAEVMLATLNALIAHQPPKLGRRPGVRRLKKRLLAEQKRSEQATLGDPTTRAAVLTHLHCFHAHVSAWQLTPRPGIALVERDLTRIYKQGQKRHLRVLRGNGNQAIAMHEWRKRVKDLRYATEMLQRRDLPKRPTPDRRLRTLARHADTLGELLGQDHDLAVLAQRLRAGKHAPPDVGGPHTWRTKPNTRRALLKAIAKRRRELRKRALRDGARLYRLPPKKFLTRIS